MSPRFQASQRVAIASTEAVPSPSPLLFLSVPPSLSVPFRIPAHDDDDDQPSFVSHNFSSLLLPASSARHLVAHVSHFAHNLQNYLNQQCRIKNHRRHCRKSQVTSHQSQPPKYYEHIILNVGFD